MTNKEYYTYKFYDETGRRLAIKGEEYNNRLLFTVLTCSKQDQFSKKFARNALNGIFEAEVTHPQKFSIPILDGKGGKTFIDYLNKNYCRSYKKVVAVTVEVLRKNRKFIKTVKIINRP